MTDKKAHPDKTFRVLEICVDAVQIPELVEQFRDWISVRNASHFIAVTGMHGVMEAHHDAGFKVILNGADMVVPDGMPLIWLGRLQGFKLARRVYGPELMLTFCRETAAEGYRHFLYGGAAGLPEKLAQKLRNMFPELNIVGTYSPPFRALTADEDADIVAMINGAQADVLWVGLSTPKQERWMHEHRDKLNVPVLVGVGAAFDIHAGTKKQAPAWMRENGFEWLFRVLQEPRRLWKRYLVLGSEFVFCVAWDFIRGNRG